jgi:superfamily II DNA or RNA helicase
LIEDKYLSPFRAFAPASPDLTGVRTIAGDYHEGDLADAVNKTTLVANVVETWQARAAKPPDALLRGRSGARQAPANAVSDRRHLAEYIDAYTDAIERTAIAKRFHAGEVKVVLQCRLPHDRNRLGRPVHHPSEADEKRDSCTSR